MEKEKINVVFVGHVDHGKSTLIGRLLADTNSLPENYLENLKKLCEENNAEFEYAFILDHLEEERLQNITIDTTQIFFKTEKRDYVIIDAPGHKEFLKNMITGASQAEAAILIIDVGEGVKEQTKRHSYILSFLGIKQVIIVVNKMDKTSYAQESYEKIKKELLKFLEEIKIYPSQIIPISAKQGENITSKSNKMSWYEGPCIVEALEAFKKQVTANKPLRYSVQDVYKIDDKRILVGRVESGFIREGQAVLFLPSNKKNKVKKIEVFEQKKTTAVAGECVGIILEEPAFIERGQVMSSIDNPPRVHEFLDATIFWMSKNSLNLKDEILLKCGTQKVECVLEEIKEKINSSTLEKTIGENKINETEVARIKLYLKNSLIAEDFNEIPALGRFVLIKNEEISAGGIIHFQEV